MIDSEDDRLAAPRTAEEIAELIRARKQRSAWGSVFAAAGILGFMGLAGVLVYKGSPIGMGELSLLGMFFAMAAVGAGFADPSEIKGFWK